MDYLVMEASQDQNILNQLIEENERFIINTTSKVTGRYITKSDDEWSIALTAFAQAVEDYELKKGSFLSFAKLVIHRRLIDYIRNQNKYNQELSVNPILFNADAEEEDDDISLRLAVAKKSVISGKEESVALEITAANENFKEFGFSFYDLIYCSPKHKKTKSSCAKIIICILNNPMFLNALRNTKLLPVKLLEKNTKVPRKIIERHRKYIIAAIVILSGEYPQLAEYLLYIREEMKE